jgi:hypothetical protein
MLPLFDGARALFVPVVRGVLVLAVIAVAGMVTVLGLVIRARRGRPQQRPPVGSVQLSRRPRLHEAA